MAADWLGVSVWSVNASRGSNVARALTWPLPDGGALLV